MDCLSGKFEFRSDDGVAKNMKLNAVYVTGLHFIKKANVVVVGYNFGGLLAVSLINQKVYVLGVGNILSIFFSYAIYLKDAAIEHFAIQEPEDDPQPLLWFWASFNDNATRYALTWNHSKSTF